MTNRLRILDAALDAFNRLGSHAVTTNDLADALQISVGNLYYHFRNKEQIVRALFEQLNQAWRTRLVLPDPARPTWPALDALIAEHFRIVWEYRFFYREQVSLRQRDPVLARKWTLVHQRGRQDMRQLLLALAADAPRPPADADIDHLTDVCWVLADYWLPFVESRGRALRRSDLIAGVEFFRKAVQPMLLAITPHAGAAR